MIRYNLSSIITSIGQNNFTPTVKKQVGRVYGVVTTENTPTEEMFNSVGGYLGVGTIFYLSYEQGKKYTGSIDNDFLRSCDKAKPLNPQDQYYPVLGELVILEDGPSPLSQVDKNSQQKYYSLINLWNNPQQNSQPANDDASLGITFYENPNVRPLIPYEGDNILGGRQGSSLRFSSTTRGVTPANEWSEIGGEYDPITILTNGLNYDADKNYYVEQINKDSSSIYLTSAQKIPLITDKTGILNNLTNPLNVPDYINSQIILNSDRVVLNSKKDEVMIFAKTNIELNTKYVINLNADERVHLNANAVFLGPYTTTAPQPVLLGWETYKVFEHLVKTLSKLSSQLSSAVSTQEGSAIMSLQIAGKELSSNMKQLNKLLKNIPSKKVFTS
jgi:hypothetical protein